MRRSTLLVGVIAALTPGVALASSHRMIDQVRLTLLHLGDALPALAICAGLIGILALARRVRAPRVA